MSSDNLPPVREIPPLTAEQYFAAMQRRDLESLSTLATLHKVGAFVFGAFSLCFVPHLAFGIATLFGAVPMGPEGPPPAFFGGMFAFFGAAVVGFHVALATACWLASGWIARREHHGRIMAVECVALLWTPLGTALGIYGLILLSKPHVKVAFRS